MDIHIPNSKRLQIDSQKNYLKKGELLGNNAFKKT